MLVRRERPDDLGAVRDVQVAAFRRGDAEPPEAGLLDALRRCDGWLPRFSLVVEIGGVVVGHNVCTRGFVGSVPALGLGPIGVLPGHQRDGAGSALMHAMIGAADAANEPLIALLGSPDYYGRYGFEPSATFGITAPDPSWGDSFQVRTLATYSGQRGEFRYAPPFAEL